MKKKIVNLGLLLASIAITFLLLELAARLYKKEFTFRNYPEEKRSLFLSAWPSQYDPLLGWIPRPGAGGRKNIWRTVINIGDHGVRENSPASGHGSHSPYGSILAVGDSYTFGDVVSDNETWPAILEKLTGKRVINGGVFGYGIDQSFLRAKELIRIYKPGTLILGFIPADVARCELSERTGVSKPYFDIKDGRLVLENVPVPLPKPPVVMDLFHQVFGYSFLVDRIMSKKFPYYWLQGGWHAARAHLEGERVASLLLQQLSDMGKEYSIKNIYVLAQYGEEPTAEDLAMVDRLISRIDRAMVKIIDLRDALSEVRAKDKKTYESFFKKHHMTYAGNYFVAGNIKEAMRGD